MRIGHLPTLNKSFFKVAAFVAPLFLSACVSASLEDAAPTTAFQPIQPPSVMTADEQGAANSSQTAQPVPTPASPARQLIADPAALTEQPTEQPAQQYVTTGANNTGEYPTFAANPEGAMPQMSDAERRRTEAEMTELLRARASTPAQQQQYARRLAELRRLSQSHAADAEKQISTQDLP